MEPIGIVVVAVACTTVEREADAMDMYVKHMIRLLHRRSDSIPSVDGGRSD
jgi:hypothetical protein